MKNGFKERYKGYRIMLWYDKWIITDKHGTTVAEIPTSQSAYRYIDEAILGIYPEEEEE